MTEHGRIIEDPPEVVALRERLAALEAAVQRMAAYLGVAHVLKDPKV